MTIFSRLWTFQMNCIIYIVLKTGNNLAWDIFSLSHWMTTAVIVYMYINVMYINMIRLQFNTSYTKYEQQLS